MIEAKIVADSINPVGRRITTFVCTYPRFIHSEVMTHRVFSRNAASSRAIPVNKMIEKIVLQPAEPIYWGKNQKGMQANEEIENKINAINVWNESMLMAVEQAKKLLALGVHKQIANRLLEPFAHMTTLITATEYANFFNLRAHPDAQPEFQELAFQMLKAYASYTPNMLSVGEWHLPFADQYLNENLTTEQKLKIVTARAARVSYLNFEGNIDHQKDYDLHDQLLSSGHMSPFEHAAQCTDNHQFYGNFRGWLPYRKTIPNENLELLDSSKLLDKRK